MTSVVYLNDRFLLHDEVAGASVSLFDRGYLLGDSVFETMRAYGGRPFHLLEHVSRLLDSADLLEIPLHDAARGPTEIANLVSRAVALSGLEDAYVRVTLSRGKGPSGIGIGGCGPSVFSIIVRPLVPYPEHAYRLGIESTVVRTRRVPAACLDPRIKSGNYLPSVLARRELDKRGLMEGVVLTVDGAVSGGSVSNLFLIEGATLRTPDLGSDCRPGVTRAAVLELAPTAGLQVSEERLRLEHVWAADAVFFASTLMECLPVAKLDQRHFRAPRPGDRFSRIREKFASLVASKTRS